MRRNRPNDLEGDTLQDAWRRETWWREMKTLRAIEAKRRAAVALVARLKNWDPRTDRP